MPYDAIVYTPQIPIKALKIKAKMPLAVNLSLTLAFGGEWDQMWCLPSWQFRWWDILSSQIQEVLGVASSISGSWDTVDCACIEVALRDH